MKYLILPLKEWNRHFRDIKGNIHDITADSRYKYLYDKNKKTTYRGGKDD
jgi:hypothetical protein